MSEHAVEIRGAEEFRARVLEAPAGLAVVVDFWAPWCAPCRALGPVLERAVADLGGKAVLAKVNTEEPENQPLAAEYGIRGIPAVKIFRGGAMVTEFTGALPEVQVRAILADCVPSEADRLVTAGDQLEAGGDAASAAKRWQEALGRNPRHAGAHLRLARLAAAGGDVEQTRRHLREIPSGAPERTAADALEGRLDFVDRCGAAGGLETVRARLAADPARLDLRLEEGLCLAAAGHFEEAMQAFLAVLEKDRKFRDGAAKDAMVKIFAIIGPRSPMADEYRTRLSRTLYS
jgi:putative thioredoxin